MGQISKSLAAQIAIEIAKPLLKKWSDCQKKTGIEMGLTYASKIPKEVLECFAKHPEFFSKRTGIQLVGNGFNYQSVQMDKQYPDGGRCFEPNAKEAKKLNELISEESKAKEEYNKTITDIENTLIALGTTKRIETEFPEAYAFFPAPNNTKSIMLSIAPIRDKVKKLSK